MEKISRIVRGNSRVTSTDLKSAAAARPGMPNFGRPVGESTTAVSSPTTTAARAVAIHNEMLEKKKTGGDQVVQQMADAFFETRVRRPLEGQPGDVQAGPVERPEGAHTPAPDGDSIVGATAAPPEEIEDQPRGYTPRGSFVDVRA